VSLSLVLGLGIVAFLFLYFAFKLDEDHFLLKLFLIFFFLISILLMPNAIINDNCQLMKANETILGNVTTFEYSSVCDDSASKTKTGFLKVVLWFFRIFVTYFSLYLFYFWTKRSEELKKWFGGKKY